MLAVLADLRDAGRHRIDDGDGEGRGLVAAAGGEAADGEGAGRAGVVVRRADPAGGAGAGVERRVRGNGLGEHHARAPRLPALA